MSVHASERHLIVLDGDCPSEDAEKLLQYLLADPSATVDLQSCGSLHTAVIQVLMAAEPILRLPSGDGSAANRLRQQLRNLITA